MPSFLTVISLLLIGVPAIAKEITIHGFVTEVHSGVFEISQNEAQLAFVLAHEISHVIEKHAWQAHEYHRKELMALRAGGAFVPFGGALIADLAVAGIRNAYARSLENQGD